ncbi:hypothetical protein NTHiID24_00830 [Haemophilus influenzae]|uniref:chromosome partitioning protein ParA n=1 Tax=Haemophilus influenzae TaxID=727 RepID=UPI000D8CEEB5|nr:chromosome partitioning protein ParA [Haemophilus influenzae]GBK95502.1 hypothetical protein NTHiID24_00830 [Haemophilus influenzae]
MVGVCFSIILKIIYTLGVKKEIAEEEQTIDAESVIKNFYTQTDLLKLQNDQNQIVAQHLESLVARLGDENEGSILGQVKLLRSDLSDQHKNLTTPVTQIEAYLSTLSQLSEKQKEHFVAFETQLWEKLQNFADMMSKSATETVIEALKQVIVEFNNNLTTQFGENFKELNRAVHSLVEWQENYKAQLSEMISLYQTGVQTLEKTEQSVANIEQSTQSIPNSMENLNSVIAVNQQQIDNLEAHLATFADLRDKAVDAIPQIQQQITLMLDNTEKANESLIQGLKQSGEKLAQDIMDVSTSFASHSTQVAENLATHFAETGETFASMMLASSQDLTESLNQNNQALVNSASTLESTSKNMLESQQVLNKAQQTIHEQITDFVSQWQQKFEQQAEQLQRQFVQQAQELMKSQMDDSRKVMNRLEEESQNALKRTGESINKQIQALDKALEEELQRVMTDMGRALASISHQFTSDYTKLVEAMQRITTKGRG